MKSIILIAPPAAGKGTQAALIAKEYYIPHISIGQLLRNEAKAKTEIGLMIQDEMKTGRLIQDNIVKKLLEGRITKWDCNKGFVLDGFPRNMNQVEMLETICEKINYKINYVILIEVAKDIIEKRVLGRLVCENCKAGFNLHFDETKPTEVNKCDYCGGNLVKRGDDNEATFAKRYKVYELETKPIIDYYQSKIKKVDGSKSIAETFAQIKKVLNEE